VSDCVQYNTNVRDAQSHGPPAANWLLELRTAAYLPMTPAYMSPKLRCECSQLSFFLRAQANLSNQINLMLPVQPRPKKYSAFAVGQITAITSPVHPGKRGVSRSSRTRGWMRWTQRRRARSWSQGGFSRERSNVAQATGVSRPSPEPQSASRRSEGRWGALRTAKSCGSGIRG